MTKKIIKTIILLLFAKNCFCQEIEISRDTIILNINANMGPCVVFKNNFYCFCKKGNDVFAKTSEYLLVFNRKGEILKKTIAPRNIQIYYDLFIKNDSVFVMDYYNHDTYFISDTYDFLEIERVDDLIYQDSIYYVTSIDQGEWGGTTWFIDKKTKQEYELGISTPIINKFQNNYILTLGKHLFEIKNPTHLKECTAPRDYNTVFQTENIFWETTYLQGINEIFVDTNNVWDSKFNIMTSTILNNKLYHLCVDSNISYLATLEAGKLIPVFTFEKGLVPFRSNFHDRNRIIDNIHQSIQFETEDDQLFGILEFKGDKIVQTYFHNLYKTHVWGTESSKQNLMHMFDYYLNNIDSLKISNVDSIETILKAENIMPGRFTLNSVKEHQIIEPPRIYRKIEDSCMQLITIYGYTAETKNIEIINFEWKEHCLFNKELFFFHKEILEEETLITEKMNWLIAQINNRFGKTDNDIKGKNFRDIWWKTDTFSLNLHGNFSNSSKNYYSVQLSIYKK